MDVDKIREWQDYLINRMSDPRETASNKCYYEAQLVKADNRMHEAIQEKAHNGINKPVNKEVK